MEKHSFVHCAVWRRTGNCCLFLSQWEEILSFGPECLEYSLQQVQCCMLFQESQKAHDLDTWWETTWNNVMCRDGSDYSGDLVERFERHNISQWGLQIHVHNTSKYSGSLASCFGEPVVKLWWCCVLFVVQHDVLVFVLRRSLGFLSLGPGSLEAATSNCVRVWKIPWDLSAEATCWINADTNLLIIKQPSSFCSKYADSVHFSLTPWFSLPIPPAFSSWCFVGWGSSWRLTSQVLPSPAIFASFS